MEFEFEFKFERFGTLVIGLALGAALGYLLAEGANGESLAERGRRALGSVGAAAS